MKGVTIFALVLLLLSCGKEKIQPDPDPHSNGPVVLKFATDAIRVAKTGGVYTVKIDANTKFRAAASPLQGTGGKPDIYTDIRITEQNFSTNQMTIRVAASTGTLMKDSTLTITTPDGKDSAHVIITQEGDPAMMPFDEKLKNFTNYIMGKTAETFDLFYTVEAIYTKTANLSWAASFYNKPVPVDSKTVEDMWAKAYHTIRSINVLINEPEMPDSLKASYTALRSIIYAQMLTLWKNIPYIATYEIQYTPSQMAYEEVLRELVSKLTQSRLYLKKGKTDDVVLISSDGAAQALAKLLMLQEKFPEALALLNEIIASKKYTLAASRDVVFKKSNPELLQGMLIPERTGIAGTTNYFEELHPQAEIFPVAIYRETMALAAECNLRLGDKIKASALLNQIETAKGLLPKYNEATISMNDIQKVFETDLQGVFSYFDFLKRINMAEAVLGIKAYQVVLPIPLRELLLNPKILQNQGY